MKTIKQLKADIKAQERILAHPPKNKVGKVIKSASTKASKRIEFLRNCIAYLESQPDEKALSEKAAKLKAQYEAMLKNYFATPPPASAKFYKIFESESGAGKIRAYHETITFLLGV
jgi:uncharacterized protein YeeX (DUF496 family)